MTTFKGTKIHGFNVENVPKKTTFKGTKIHGFNVENVPKRHLSRVLKFMVLMLRMSPKDNFQGY